MKKKDSSMQKNFLSNVWTKHVCPLLLFLTRVDTVILFSIFILTWFVIKTFLIIHHQNVVLAEMTALTFEEAHKASRFSAFSGLFALVGAFLAWVVVSQYAFFGAWSVHEPMFFEHPDFVLYFALAILVIAYLCLLGPIYCKVLYALYRKLVFLCGTKTCIFFLVTAVAFLCPFGFADCSGLDLSPMQHDSEIEPVMEPIFTQEVGTQTSAPWSAR